MNMTARPATPDCRQVADIFNRVGDKWSMQVVVVLRDRPARFNELRRQVNGISQQMLTRTLKLLERDGLVERAVQAASPPQVHYSLTPLGLSLAGPVRELAEWARRHLDALEENRRRYDSTVESRVD